MSRPTRRCRFCSRTMSGSALFPEFLTNFIFILLIQEYEILFLMFRICLLLISLRFLKNFFYKSLRCTREIHYLNHFLIKNLYAPSGVNGIESSCWKFLLQFLCILMRLITFQPLLSAFHSTCLLNLSSPPEISLSGISLSSA